MICSKKVLTGLAALLVAATAVPVGATQATAAPEATVQAPPATGALQVANARQIIDVFNAINEFRRGKGLQPVTFNVTASEVSEDWSDTMARTRSFRHNPGYGSDPRVAGRWSAAGEIIAARWDTSGKGLVTQWINSPGHNAIMSDPRYKSIGVGISITGNTDPRSDPAAYTMYGTVNFFAFRTPPAGTYTTAQDYFEGRAAVVAALPVTAEAPGWNGTARRYTIPSVKGVEYLLGQKVLAPGTYAASGRVTITARATSGHVLRAGTTARWTATFRTAGSPA